MTTHQVTLNGKAIAVAGDRFKLLTMLRSVEHEDGDGNKFAAHELVIEGIDASGREDTQFISSVLLKNGDVVQILISETHDT